MNPVGGSDQIDLSTQAVFDYFPAWESSFEYEGRQFGGHVNDYKTPDRTILNHPALADAIDLAGKNLYELSCATFALDDVRNITLERYG
jgi:hypothetical protein